MFKQAGQFTGTITQALIAEPKFAQNDPNAFDVCLKIKGPDYNGQIQEDWWRGEMSGRIAQKGIFKGKSQYEITMADLKKIGFDDESLQTLDTLIGRKIPITVQLREYDGKTYYDINYIGSDYAPAALDTKSMQERLAVLKGGVKGTASNAETQEEDSWI